MEIEKDVTVEGLKCLLEVETAMPIDEQVIFFHNQPLMDDDKTLTSLGVLDSDLL